MRSIRCASRGRHGVWDSLGTQSSLRRITPRPNMPPCVAGGCICCIYGCDSDLSICYKGEGEMCCLTGEACLAKDERMLGPGMITNPSKGECCKIGCFCCSYGFKMPNSICNGWSRCLCCFDAYSFPYGENTYLTKCHCTVWTASSPQPLIHPLILLSPWDAPTHS